MLCKFNYTFLSTNLLSADKSTGTGNGVGVSECERS